MDNKCENEGPLNVPGFGGIPLEHELPVSERFAHGINDWKQVPAITLREFAMVAAMNDLTDKPGWQNDIFDEKMVGAWREEIFAARQLVSPKAWDWCVAELRDKASFFKDHNFVQVLDTGSRVCKSDSQALQDLSTQFRSALEPILASRTARLENNHTRLYVDPSLQPLVYGKTPILDQEEEDLKFQKEYRERSISATSIAPQHVDKRINSDKVEARMNNTYVEPWSYAFVDVRHDESPAYFWSYKYQWLPSEVEFTSPHTTEVKLASPVSDLDPRHTLLYGLLEKLISLSIEPWNQCLINASEGREHDCVRVRNGWAPPENKWQQRGRVPCRIITYGVEWENEMPDWFKYFDTRRQYQLRRWRRDLVNLEALKKEKPCKKADKKLKTDYKEKVKKLESSLKYLSMEGVEDLPEPTPEQWIEAQDFLERPEDGSELRNILPDDWRQNVRHLLIQKIKKILRFKHPEPGSAFSYEQWRSGQHGGRAIVDMVTDRPIDPAKIPPTTPHETYTIKLQDRFFSKGLQVIVRVESVELNPEEPSFPGSTWQIEGQKNEHIVAMSMLAYDVHNVTPSHVSFRQETETGQAFFNWGFELYHDQPTSMSKGPPSQMCKGDQIDAICEVFGWNPHQMYGDNWDHALPLQDVGKITLPQGRVITFPHVMDYRREPFALEDPTKPGHHRVITLMLVDPHYRICSTRNVVAQPKEKNTFPESVDENGEAFSHEDVKSQHHERNDADSQRYKLEMSQEHGWMLYKRYSRMGVFFFL